MIPLYTMLLVVFTLIDMWGRDIPVLSYRRVQLQCSQPSPKGLGTVKLKHRQVWALQSILSVYDYPTPRRQCEGTVCVLQPHLLVGLYLAELIELLRFFVVGKSKGVSQPRAMIFSTVFFSRLERLPNAGCVFSFFFQRRGLLALFVPEILYIFEETVINHRILYQ